MDFDGSHALIIGIDSYRSGIPPLGNAVRDAAAVADLLEADHDFAVQRLLDTDATHDALAEALELLAADVGEDDRVFVYFAGHGIAQDGDDGPEGFLVPVDAAPEDRDSLFPMLRLNSALADLPCRHLLLVLDCCFAGSFRWAATRSFLPGAQTMYRKRYERFVGEPAWQVLTSTAPDQKALDLLDGLTIGARETSTDHSPFAAALLDGLAGGADRPGPDGETDGVVTATELYLHVRDVVELGAEAQGKEQTPGLWPLPKHGRGEFLFHVPGRELALVPDPVLDASANPWPGLAAYDTHQADLFFGRTRVVAALQERLTLPEPLVAVIGASGTGKSSVVKAGLAAAAATADEPWSIVGPHRPGEDPVGILRVLSDEIADTPVTAPVLVLLDQFEEIYTLCRDPEARAGFLDGFVRLLDDLPERAKVVLTARSDFLPQLRAGPLADRIEAARFTVPPMTTDELREVVEGPAQARVLYFEPPGLVDRLVDEVVAMPGALPLLSFTLSELYIRYLESGREDRALRGEDYDALGGVVGSLRSRASALYDEASPAEKHTIERVMIRMVAIEGGDLAKRRVTLAELDYEDPEEDARVEHVLDRFTDARLLLRASAEADTGRSWGGEVDHSWVEPTHDMLVIAWDRVHLWLDRLGPEIHLQRMLWAQASAWSQGEGSASLWHDDPRLAVVEAQLARPDGWMNQAERAFVSASIHRRDRNARIKRIAIAAFIVVIALGLAGVSYFAYDALKQRDAAEVAQKEAERERDQAMKLTMFAGAQTARDPTTSAVLLRDLGSPEGLPLWSFVVTDTVGEPISRQAFQGHTGAVTRAIFDPDGSRVLTTSDDGSARIWPLSDRVATALKLSDRRGTRVVLEEGGAARLDGAWSPDEEHVVIGAQSGEVNVYNSWTGALVKQLSGPSPPTHAVAWSPDGTMIAASGASGRVVVWDAVTFAIVHEVDAPEDCWGLHLDWRHDSEALAVAGVNGWAAILHPRDRAVQVLAPPADVPEVDWLWAEFRPGGDDVALAGEAGQAGIWTADGRRRTELNSSGRVRVVRWSPDGKVLITAGSSHVAILWNHKGKLLHRLEGHRGAILHAEFVPGDGTVLTASMDNTIRRWAVSRGLSLVTFRGHAAGVRRVDVRPDGQRFVSASGDWTARLWSPRNASESVDLPVVGTEVKDVAWSPDCQWLGATSAHGLVRLFEAPGRKPPLAFKMRGEATHVAFSPDGERVASAASGGQIAVRRCATKTPSGSDCAEWGTNRTMLERAADGDAVTAMAWGGSPPFLATANEDENARIWRFDDGTISAPTVLAGHEHPLTTVAVTTDGSRVATGSLDRRVLLWDPAAPDAPVKSWTYARQVREVGFSPDGTQLAVITEGNAVHIQRLDGEPRKLGEHNGRVNDMAWSRSGAWLITGSGDHTAKIWDVAAGAVAHELKGHTGPVVQVAFNHDDSIALTGSYDTTVRMWIPETGKVRTPSQVVDAYEGAVTDVAPGCRSGSIFSAAADGSLRNTHVVSVDQQRALLGVLTDYCIPPGEAHLLTGLEWEEASRRYKDCLASQAAGGMGAEPFKPE